MRKMKKINGFLVVRFNDREKRNNPTLGSFGVIDAEQYTGDLDFDLDAFEQKLERTLSQVEGAGETQVILTLDGGSRQVLARNQEREGDGGTSNTVVTVGKGSGAQEVVPLQTVAPQFRGALVVCPGGGDPQVRLRMIEAVSALTGLGSDRISVCQRG